MVMKEPEFRSFLKKTKRNDSAIEQIVGFVSAFQTFLQVYYPHKSIEQTTIEVVESYVSWLESETGDSASKPLWALRYYFDFIENKVLSDLAGELRGERIKRKPFMIANFRGVNPGYIAKLESLYTRCWMPVARPGCARNSRKGPAFRSIRSWKSSNSVIWRDCEGFAVYGRGSTMMLA